MTPDNIQSIHPGETHTMVVKTDKTVLGSGVNTVTSIKFISVFSVMWF
jgi:hypothetical protein